MNNYTFGFLIHFLIPEIVNKKQIENEFKLFMYLNQTSLCVSEDLYYRLILYNQIKSNLDSFIWIFKLLIKSFLKFFVFIFVLPFFVMFLGFMCSFFMFTAQQLAKF